MKLFTIILISAAISSPLAASEAIDSLLDQMSGDDYAAKQEARDTLYSMAAEATAEGAEPASLIDLGSAMLDALLEPQFDTQAKVFLTRILARIGTGDCVPALIGIALDSNVDPIVREHAAMALSAIPGEDVSKQLIRGLKSANASDKEFWWQALQHQMDSSMVKSLISEIGKNQIQDNPVAWTALGKIGGTEAAEFLAGLLDKVDGDQASILGKAILESNGCNPRQLKGLLDKSTDISVKTGAYRQLAGKDPSTALKELETILNNPASPLRQNVMRISLETADQQFWNVVVAKLPGLTSAEVNTFLMAVGEQNRYEYEDQVMDYLTGQTQLSALHALANIGTDKSTPVLLKQMEDDDETIQDLAIYALSQVNDPGLDEQIVARVKDVQSSNREEMIRLIAIRNSDGAIDILNSILMKGSEDPAISAILDSIEEIGDINSCRILLSRLLDNPKSSDLRRYQLTLKRLAIRFSMPDHLWDNAFYPAVLLASGDTQKGSIIEILDCLSTKDAMDYCIRCLKDGNSETVQKAALAAMRRWTELNIFDYWLDVVKNNDSTDQELKDARSALIRIISSKSVSGNAGDKAKLALEILLEVEDEELEDQVYAELQSNKSLGKEFTKATEAYRSIIETWDKLG